MKICFFSAQYLPTVGGVERYTHNLASCLAREGHKVIIVTSSLQGLPDRETESSGTEIFRLPVWPFMGGRFPIIKKNAQFLRITEELWSAKPDAVVINTHFYTSSVYAAKMASSLAIPSLLINHGTQYLMTGVLAPLGKIYERMCARFVKYRCNAFFGVSRACSAWLENFGIQSDGEIYNAVDPIETKRLAQGSSLDVRRSLGLEDSTPLIAYSGRMIPEKGVLQLAKAVEQIRVRVSGAVVVMAGEGESRAALEASQTDGLYLLGQLSYQDSLALILQSDTLCLPTRSEGFSGVVLEAAALGTAIITTATGGSTELIVDGRHGKLIPDMLPQTIACACADALLDPEWRIVAAANAKARLRQCFTWNKSAQSLIEAVREMIQRVGTR
ncbi:MAG: glycosyltransferase family 4 protein [Oscillospiraceae bacterium]